MIITSLHDAGRYTPLLSRLSLALDYLQSWQRKNLGEAGIPVGRTPLYGEEVFAIMDRYNTRDTAGLVSESHRKYVDVQCLISGQERVLWTPLELAGEPSMQYDPARDVQNYHLHDRYSDYLLAPGQLMILFPEDVHLPCCHPQDDPVPIQKIVVKVAVD